MTAPAATIARLRRLTNEPDATTYDDSVLSEYLERYPLIDDNGNSPTIVDPLGLVPAVANPLWVATYDIYAAAADIMEEKAAIVAQDFKFSADNGSYDRNQVFEQYMKLVKNYRSRRNINVIAPFIDPNPVTDYETLYVNGIP
jgi:hypothetical protein